MNPTKPPRLLDQVRQALRSRHYSYLTEKAYVGWIKRFILFHGKRHPSHLGTPEIEAFLSWLAQDRKVAASTQNQALSALLFLYSKVLGTELPWLKGVIRAKRPERLPVVLTANEVEAVLARLDGIYWLIASLLYGSGLRLMECLRLRVKDIELTRRQLVIRDGKGAKDRVTMLADQSAKTLAVHLERRREQHRADVKHGGGEVYLPYALTRKYRSAARQWPWQFVFAAKCDIYLPELGRKARWHLHEKSVQYAVRNAVLRSGVSKPATCHTLRHSFATHLLQQGQDIRTIQKLLGHKDVSTTMLYTHVAGLNAVGTMSPLDTMTNSKS